MARITPAYEVDISNELRSECAMHTCNTRTQEHEAGG